jgi:hypothetical protein
MTTQDLATTPTNRQVLEACLDDMKTSYLELLAQPGALSQAREAGRTVRYLARCLSETDGFDADDLDDEEAELETDDL